MRRLVRMRSVLQKTVILSLLLGLVPAVASAHGNRHHPNPHPSHSASVSAAEACASLWVMTEMAQAEQGWYGHARAMDDTREAACAGQAPSARWSSGHALRSANGWHYPDGRVAIQGSAFYYPSGRPAYASQTWRYPDGRVAFARGTWYRPDGQRVRALGDMIDATCGSYDPTCDRYLAGAQRRQSFAYEAAGMRFAWQSRPEWSSAPRPAPGSYHAPHHHAPRPAAPAPPVVAHPTPVHVPAPVYVPRPVYVPQPVYVPRPTYEPPRAHVEVRIPRRDRTRTRRVVTRRAQPSAHTTFSASARFDLR